MSLSATLLNALSETRQSDILFLAAIFLAVISPMVVLVVSFTYETGRRDERRRLSVRPL